MSKALSFDLRVRAVAAAEAGMPHRRVAERFGVSAASVSRWRAITRAEGAPIAEALGGDRRSKRVENAAPAILSALTACPDITIEELAKALSREGLHLGSSTLGRFFKRHRITRKKKTAHVAEQTRPDVLKARQVWFAPQPEFDPARLVFIDETWTKTNMDTRKNLAVSLQM